MRAFLREFRAFASRGNVIDLAVGVIIGSAFSAITTSLVNDIVMPLLGIFTDQISFADLSVTIGGAVITYGNFLQAVLNFIIMSFIVVCMVKAIYRLHRKPAEEKAAEEKAPPAPSREEVLLAEIRDLLKEKQS